MIAVVLVGTGHTCSTHITDTTDTDTQECQFGDDMHFNYLLSSDKTGSGMLSVSGTGLSTFSNHATVRTKENLPGQH